MKYRQRKCRCCHEWFLPQAHNAYHQRYCTDPDCRRASKRSSQRRWFQKNRDHYRGAINVERVQDWRDEHPDYARGRRRVQRLLMNLRIWPDPPRDRRVRLRVDNSDTGGLQDLYFTQPLDAVQITLNLKCALQDFIGITSACCYT